MYRPGTDVPQFRPVPVAPPPSGMMGGPFVSPPPPIPPSILPPIQGRPHVMHQYSFPPPAPHPPPPLLVPPPASLRSSLPPIHPALPSVRPPVPPSLPLLPPSQPSAPASLPLLPPSQPSVRPPVPPSLPLLPPSQPSAPASLPRLQPSLPLMQPTFPSMQPSLPSMQPSLPPFQLSLPPAQPSLPLFPPPLPLIQPAPFLPPLPPSPPSENPPPPPPSPPPEAPPFPNVEESSLAADLLPPEPPKPNDPEMLKNIDVLAAFVVKNGPRFESMARARQAGDPKFAFLFESDAAPEAAIGHEFYKWKKQSLALELGLEIENKASNQVDSGASSVRVQLAKVVPGQPPLPADEIPESPAMSDMDMEDDFAPSPAKREPIGQLEGVNPEAEECLSSKTPFIEYENAQEKAGALAIQSFGDVPRKQDHDSSYDGNSKRASHGGTLWTSTLPCDADENRENLFPGLLQEKNKTLHSHPADKVRESHEKTHDSNLINTNQHMQRGGHTVSILNDDIGDDWEPSRSLQKLSDYSSQMTEQDHQREAKIADVSREKHVPSEFLSGSFEHPVKEVTPAHQERRVGRISRWGSMPPSQPLQALKESEDSDKPNFERIRSPSRFIKDGGKPQSEEAASPSHAKSFSDFGDTSKDVQRPMIIDNARGRSFAADADRQQSQEALSVDEFGRLVRERATESDSEEEQHPRKRRRSDNRSRSKGRNRSRSKSQSHSSGESRWRRRSFSPLLPRRGRWSRSRSRSPTWRRSYSRSPPREMRWGGIGRGERDWRGERDSYGRGRRGGRGSGPNLCFHYARGSCFRGNACRFLHPDREIGQEQGVHLREFRSERHEADGFKDVESGQGAYFTPRKPDIEAAPYLDLTQGDKEGDEAQRSVADRERLATLKAVDMTQFREIRDQAGESAPDKDESTLLRAFAQVSNIRERKAVENLNIYGAIELAGEPYVVGEMEVVEKSAAGGEMQAVGDVIDKSDINRKTELVGKPNTNGKFKVADESGIRAIKQVVGKSENHEGLEVGESTEKDVAGNLDTPGDFEPAEKLLINGEAEMVGESELNSEADTNCFRVERKDLSAEVSAADKPEMPSEIEVHGKADVKINMGRPEHFPEVKLPEKLLVTAEKPELSSEAEVTTKLEKSTIRGSTENAMNNSGVDGEPQGEAIGNEALRPPMVPGAPLFGVSFPPVLPFSQTNSTGESTYMASSSNHQYISNEQRHAPVVIHQHLSSVQHPLSAGNMSCAQSNPLRPPVMTAFTNTGHTIPSRNFNPPHPLSGQQPNLISGNAGPRQSFLINNPSQSQQVFLPRAYMHGPPSLPHNHGTLSQPSYGTSFPAKPGFTQNTTHQSAVPPQDQLLRFTANQPAQFPSNPSISQQHTVPSYPAIVFQSGQHGLSASLSLSREDSSYSRSFAGDTAKQYTHPTLMSDGLQHAYPRPTITQSAASTHHAMQWMDSASLNSLAASISVLPSTAEQPSSYSYSLTTIPPLSNLIKLPGGSNLPTSGDQYDPLSDVLDTGPSGALKSMSSRPSGDGGSVGVGFLENVSPGLDTEKSNILACKPEVDTANMNEAAADVGVVENVSPPGDWSPGQPGDRAEVGHDQAQSNSKKSIRGLKLLRAAVADRVKELLKPTWREGHMSKEAFKTIAKKAVEKVTGNLPSHHVPKSQEKVDQFMAVSSTKISKLVQGYVDKYLKL